MNETKKKHKKKNDKINNWSEIKENYLKFWREECQIYNYLYNQNVYYYRNLDRYLGVSAILLSAVTGSTLVNQSSTSSYKNSDYEIEKINYILLSFGMISMVNTFIQSVRQFLDLPSKISSNHNAAIQNSSIALDIDEQLMMTRKDRTDAKEFMKQIKIRKNELIKTGPDIPKREWSKFIKKVENGEPLSFISKDALYKFMEQTINVGGSANVKQIENNNHNDNGSNSSDSGNSVVISNGSNLNIDNLEDIVDDNKQFDNNVNNSYNNLYNEEDKTTINEHSDNKESGLYDIIEELKKHITLQNELIETLNNKQTTINNTDVNFKNISSNNKIISPRVLPQIPTNNEKNNDNDNDNDNDINTYSLQSYNQPIISYAKQLSYNNQQLQQLQQSQPYQYISKEQNILTSPSFRYRLPEYKLEEDNINYIEYSTGNSDTDDNSEKEFIENIQSSSACQTQLRSVFESSDSKTTSKRRKLKNDVKTELQQRIRRNSSVNGKSIKKKMKSNSNANDLEKTNLNLLNKYNTVSYKKNKIPTSVDSYYDSREKSISHINISPRRNNFKSSLPRNYSSENDLYLMRDSISTDKLQTIIDMENL
jgi:hypothetical protein